MRLTRQSTSWGEEAIALRLHLLRAQEEWRWDWFVPVEGQVVEELHGYSIGVQIYGCRYSVRILSTKQCKEEVYIKNNVLVGRRRLLARRVHER